MALAIRIIDSPKGETVTKWNIVFPKEGGKIGRRSDSTLVLNDAKRIISGEHAKIELTNNGYRITDLSTNGLYINRANTPLGRNHGIGLNDGDVLTIGEYSLLVSIDDVAKGATAPAKEEEVFDPFAKQGATSNASTSDTSAGTQHSLLDEFPDPFLQHATTADSPTDDDPYITATNYDYERSANADAQVTPKDDILEESKEFEIRKDPFATEPNANGTPHSTNNIKPRRAKPLSLDNRNMFGNNPFNRSNEFIDTPLGEMNDGNGDLTFMSLGIALQRQQAMMEEALIMSLGRFLTEVGPEHFMEIYAIFNKRRFFKNYWKSYCQYYKLNIDNKEWQQKFIMYFRESLEIIKKRNNQHYNEQNYHDQG